MPPVSAGRATRVAQLLGMAPSPPPPGRIPAMLAARRRMIDLQRPIGVSHPGEHKLIARGNVSDMLLSDSSFPDVEGQWSSSPDERLKYRIEEANRTLDARAAGGLFSPTAAFPGIDHPFNRGVLGLVSYPQANRQTRRHEVMHGMTEAARQGLPGMPAWSRLAASNPLGLGRYLDELGATATEGTLAMAGRIPSWPSYAYQYAREGQPASAAAAAATYLVPVVGAGVGASLARDYILGEPQDKQQGDVQEVDNQRLRAAARFLQSPLGSVWLPGQ